MNFVLSNLRNSNIWSVYRMQAVIQMDPTYQREGQIWNLEKRQLLIDTIFNQFDVPKIYLHKFATPLEVGQETYEYAVIDGKQRLSAIFQFIEGGFSIADDFEYLRQEEKGENIDLSGFRYQDVASKYPLIKTDFDAYPLDIVCIETADTELIEELFSRLNEAVPLNAPEKRNALPGPLPRAVRRLVEEDFFTRCLPFSNRRYRHYDLAAKMLLAEHRDEVVDTKKAYLDRFFKSGPELGEAAVFGYVDDATSTLELMSAAFGEKDELLRQVGMVFLYFHLFRRVSKQGLEGIVSRDRLLEFERRRSRNRELAENSIAEADYSLLEFDRLAQSPNDGVAIRFRLGVLDKELFEGRLGFPLLVDDGEGDPVGV